MSELSLRADVSSLTEALVNIASVSLSETAIADAVEAALREQTSGYEIVRNGNAVLARTHLGRDRRVLLAGHLDTVPIAENVPAHREGGVLYGCGTVDMKSGDAVFLHLAATLAEPRHDLTLVFYDAEEIAAKYNGLGRIQRELPEWLTADLAILGEPTAGWVEGGCQGSIRITLRAKGLRAHSARSWLGSNAIHHLAPALQLLQEYRPRTVEIDGLEYREGLNAVRITGGVAGNVVPDAAELDVNFRFAPDRSLDAAQAYLLELFAPTGLEIVVDDAAAGALPGLAHPAAAEFARLADGRVRAKYGWTDVSRFAALGIPALNFGPGDPNLAHKPEEHVELAQIDEVAELLRRFLA